jgi:hypothetical protein
MTLDLDARSFAAHIAGRLVLRVTGLRPGPHYPYVCCDYVGESAEVVAAAVAVPRRAAAPLGIAAGARAACEAHAALQVALYEAAGRAAPPAHYGPRLLASAAAALERLGAPAAPDSAAAAAAAAAALGGATGRGLLGRVASVAAQLAQRDAAGLGAAAEVARFCLAAQRAAALAATAPPATAAAGGGGDASGGGGGSGGGGAGEWLRGCAVHVAGLLGEQMGASIWGGGSAATAAGGGGGKDGEDWLQSPLLARGLAGGGNEWRDVDEEWALEALLLPQVALGFRSDELSRR